MLPYRFRKPEWVPTIAMLITVALMCSLGTWQLKRLEWKNALLAKIEQAQSQAPKELLSYPTASLPTLEWHNVSVSGRLLNERELYATPRYLNGQMGYAVLTPLAISTPTGTEYILINRGWVPPEKKEAGKRAKGNVEDIVTVEGVIRNTQPQGSFRPNNRPDKNLWFWYDLPAMAKETQLKLLPVMIDATRITFKDGTAIGEGPTPFPLEITIRNDHLGYAITWFMIGLSALVMYGCYYAERKK